MKTFKNIFPHYDETEWDEKLVLSQRRRHVCTVPSWCAWFYKYIQVVVISSAAVEQLIGWAGTLVVDR